MQVGDLIEFIPAPGRWHGEGPRCPGENIVGKIGIIVDGPFEDSHDWGGVWYIECLGSRISHWGDFMEVVSES